MSTNKRVPAQARAQAQVKVRQVRVQRVQSTTRLLGKMSQRALAKKAGLHYSYISLVLRGMRRPSIDALNRIARALGLSMGVAYAKLLDMEEERRRRVQRKRQKKGR